MAAPATSKRRSGNRRAFLVLLTLGGISAGGWLLAQAQTASFTFAAAGDHGTGPNTAAVFEQIGPSGASFFLSLGDLIYSRTYGEAKWCEFVKSHLGPRGATFPVQIIAGAHEDGVNHREGLIDAVIAEGCLPNRLPAVQSPLLGTDPSPTGNYAKEYYFDYPSSAPLARLILISPALHFKHGGRYDYSKESPRYRWVASTIEDAKAKRIPWVIVGMHRNCITMGIKSCEIGADIFNLLVSMKVDLILQGHDHNYQRSKQLAISASCPAIAPGSFDPRCVVDPNATDAYARGAGTVLIINGLGGTGRAALDRHDAEAPYFVTSQNSSYGIVKFVVSEHVLSGSFVKVTGSYTDSFSISARAQDRAEIR